MIEKNALATQKWLNRGLGIKTILNKGLDLCAMCILNNLEVACSK
jgi:hypothetical protein